MLIFIAFILALAITMVAMQPLMLMAKKMSLVDVPDTRKVHTGTIPRVGGIAMVAGTLVPLLIWLPMSAQWQSYIAAIAVLLVFTIWDDSKDIDYRFKFLGQLIATSIVVFMGGVKLSILPFMGIDPVSDYLSIPLTIFFLVGITNAVNLSDGLDGLAAGVMFISLSIIGLLAYFQGATDILLVCLVVIGVIFGFLRYNTYPAQVFMGDAGSQFLGLTVGILSIVLTQNAQPPFNPVLPLLLLGVPIIDTAFVMIKRLRQGRSPFSPDKNHVHHQLLDLGLAHYEAVSVIYLLQIIFVACAIGLRYQSDFNALFVYIAITSMTLSVLLYVQSKNIKFRHSEITEFIQKVDHNSRLRNLPVLLMQVGISIYLVVTQLMVTEVPVDVSIVSGVLFTLLLVRLFMADKLRFFPLRLLIFPTVAFALYLVHANDAAILAINSFTRAIVAIILLVLMAGALRSIKRDVFSVTPTDILVVFLAIGLSILYHQGLLQSDFVPVLTEIVIFFYAAEIIMKQMKSSLNIFTAGILMVLLILFIKLF